MSALGYDPVPGDVDSVQRVASLLGGVAGQAETITTRLARLDSGVGPQIWRGPAADAFRIMLSDVGPDITKLASAHREAEDALRTYAGALGAAQGSARRAESDAAAGLADRDRAECDRRRAAEEVAGHRARINECRVRIVQARAARLTALTDPVHQAEMDRYENQVRTIQRHAETGATEACGRESAAHSAQAQAKARVEAAQLLARQATEVRDHAARRAVDRLEVAGQAGIAQKNPISRLWEKAKEEVRDFATSPAFLEFLTNLDKVNQIVALVGTICTLVPFLAPLGGIILGASAILGMVLLAGTVLAALYGKRSVGDVGRAALGAIPGLGVAKKLPAGAGGVVLGELGKIKRVLKFDHRAPRVLQKVPIAPQVGGFEKVVMRNGRIDPRTYYRGRVLIDMANGAQGVRDGYDLLRPAFELGLRQVVPIPPLLVGPTRPFASVGPVQHRQETGT